MPESLRPRFRPLPSVRFDEPGLDYMNDLLNIRDQCPDPLKEDLNKVIDALLFMHHNTGGAMALAYGFFLDIKKAQMKAFPDIGEKQSG